MARFANSVLFVPTAGGTTDWTVSSAVQGFMTPALAGAPDGTYKYRAESADLSQWEEGEGVYTAAGTVLTRATVLYNSAGTGSATGQSGAGSKINFTAAPNVGIVALKQDLLAIDEANAFTAAQQLQARSNVGFGTSVINVAYATYTANALLSGHIPLDDTIPQITEGSQIITTSYTPLRSDSTLLCEFYGQISADATDNVVVAIYNGGANAIAASLYNITGANLKAPAAVAGVYAPGSTAAQTISVRIGAGTANSALNGNPSGRYLGGVSTAFLKITELK